MATFAVIIAVVGRKCPVFAPEPRTLKKAFQTNFYCFLWVRHFSRTKAKLMSQESDLGKNLSLVNYLSIFNKFVLMQLKACIPEGVLNL